MFGGEDGDVAGLEGWVVREEFEQAVFEDLQFAQGAVGADDADAVVQRGGFVGQGEGLQAVLQAVEEAVGQGGFGVGGKVGGGFAFGEGVEEVAPLFAQ